MSSLEISGKKMSSTAVSSTQIQNSSGRERLKNRQDKKIVRVK